ncbi:hypothetical protein QP028_00405 [Corynebacterium suedekumii]|nr:hypothetical protein QP028_00405 [Corynebacterium suedekumii]
MSPTLVALLRGDPRPRWPGRARRPGPRGRRAHPRREELCPWRPGPYWP